MKVYPTLDVEMSYHNFGSAWLMILRGETKEIDLVFNGLYNLSATNGECDFKDHLQTVATFWSDEKSMEKFFYNQYILPRLSLPSDAEIQTEIDSEIEKEVEEQDDTKDPAYPAAVSIASNKMNELRGCHEFFLDFNNRFVPDYYSNGKISAERLDVDMKDAILTHAYKDNTQTNHSNEQTEIR